MWSDYQAGVTGLVIFPAFFPRVLPGVGTRLFLSWPTGPGGARADCWLAHTTLYSRVSRVTPGYQLGSPVVGVS